MPQERPNMKQFLSQILPKLGSLFKSELGVSTVEWIGMSAVVVTLIAATITFVGLNGSPIAVAVSKAMNNMIISLEGGSGGGGQLNVSSSASGKPSIFEPAVGIPVVLGAMEGEEGGDEDERGWLERSWSFITKTGVDFVNTLSPIMQTPLLDNVIRLTPVVGDIYSSFDLAADLTETATSGSGLEGFLRSSSGQDLLLKGNFIWSFLAGSGNEFGTEYGPAAIIGSLGGDVTSSFIPIWGDGRDLAVQFIINPLTGKERDDLVVSLSLIGLGGDLGWLDGPVPDPVDGVNLGAAGLKTTVKALNKLPPPVQKAMREVVEYAAKNPDKIGEIAQATEWVVKHADEAEPLFEVLLKQSDNSAHLVESITKLSKIKGADTLLAKLTSNSDNVRKGAQFELEFVLGNANKVDEAGRVLEIIHGGKKEIDVVMEGNVFVNAKSYDWSKYEDFVLKMETNKMVTQATDFQQYNPSSVKYVFDSRYGPVPDSVRKALESKGIQVEVWP